MLGGLDHIDQCLQVNKQFSGRRTRHWEKMSSGSRVDEGISGQEPNGAQSFIQAQ